MRIIMFFMIILMTSNVSAAEHKKWNTFLMSHVEKGLVDYNSVAQDDVLLREYLKQLAETNFQLLSDSERLAYLINAYNAYTVALIIDNRDGTEIVASIKDIGGFFSSPWKKKVARLGGNIYTLDEVEHKLIRVQFSDPRVHFALNCASISCPPLAPFAYEGDVLDTQLDQQTRSFINTAENTELTGNVLSVSKIFDWYAEDFSAGVLPFIRANAEGELAKKMDLQKEMSLSYKSYDWSLNILQK